MNISISIFVVLVRAWRLWAFYRGGIVAQIFALSEVLVLISTLTGLWRGRVDVSRLGAITPLLYVGSLCLSPDGGVVSISAAWVTIALSVVQLILRLRMGVCCSVGVPVFVELLERWPYSWIRHPLAACEILCCTAFALTYASLWNFCALPFVAGGFVLGVVLEERFLKTLPEYREFCNRVPWRFVPGVV